MGNQHGVQVFGAYPGHCERTSWRCRASLASVLQMLPTTMHWAHLWYVEPLLDSFHHCIIHSMVCMLVLGRWYQHCHSWCLCSHWCRQGCILQLRGGSSGSTVGSMAMCLTWSSSIKINALVGNWLPPFQMTASLVICCFLCACQLEIIMHGVVFGGTFGTFSLVDSMLIVGRARCWIIHWWLLCESLLYDTICWLVARRAAGCWESLSYNTICWLAAERAAGCWESLSYNRFFGWLLTRAAGYWQELLASGRACRTIYSLAGCWGELLAADKSCWLVGELVVQ